MSEQNDYTYRDLSTLVRILKISLIASVGICLVSIWSAWLQIDLLQLVQRSDLGVPEEMAEANDTRQMLVLLIYLITYLVTIVIFFRWVYLSNRNAHALGARGMEFTPGWAVGWFFVPFANLWQPYKAMKETFQASHPSQTDNWHHVEPPSILAVWWGLWIISLITGRVAGRTTTDSIDDMITSTWTGIASDAVEVILLLVTLVIVSKLSTWQSEKREVVANAVPAGPDGIPLPL